MQDSTTTTAPRFDVLHEVLARAAQLGVTVTLTVHEVPTEVALELLQEGLLDGIEKGAGGNPPTGRMASGEWPNGKAELLVFMERPEERERRIARTEDAAVAELAEELAETPRQGTRWGVNDFTPEARS